MNRKLLKEINEIIYAVCTLCRNLEKAGFIEGIKVGVRLSKELLDIQLNTDISCTQLVKNHQEDDKILTKSYQ